MQVLHEILGAANSAITFLSAVNPAWYVVAVGPLANVAQHFLKKERAFSHGQNQLIAVGLAGFAGAFYGILHTPAGATFAQQAVVWLKDTALVGSPIWLTAFALYHAVSKKLEQRHELLLDSNGNPTAIVDNPTETVTVEHVVTEPVAPQVDAVTPGQKVDF